jgi:hypothetical protein
MVEVEKPLEGLPLANVDQWNSPPAVASMKEAQDAPPKKSKNPHQK